MKFLQPALWLWLDGAVLPDYLEQKVEIERLGQRCNSAKRARRLCGIHRARHHRNRNAGDHRISQLRASELVAAHPRHAKVEQDQARRVGLAVPHRAEQVQPLETILGRDHVKALAAEQRHEHFACIRIVVNDDYQTSLPGVWAGGDCVDSKHDLTVQAVEDGKRAAASIDRALRQRVSRNGGG